jgi:hypothetical protein
VGNIYFADGQYNVGWKINRSAIMAIVAAVPRVRHTSEGSRPEASSLTLAAIFTSSIQAIPLHALPELSAPLVRRAMMDLVAMDFNW